VDRTYLDGLLLSKTGETCPGCNRFVLSRHLLQHNEACPALLRLRIRESSYELRLKEGMYRSLLQEHDKLRAREDHLTFELHHLHQMLRSHPAHSPGSLPPLGVSSSDDGNYSEDSEEEEGDEEVVETFEVPQLVAP
jgi:hypothetical protein